MKLKKFFTDFMEDKRIPRADKKILIGFFVASIFPVIFIPGWISPEGFFISLFLFSFVPDYFFNVLDQDLFLSLYPYDLKSYSALKRTGQFISVFTPSFITTQIFTYKKEVIK